MFGAFIITGTTAIVNKYHYVTSNVGFFVYGGLFIHIISFIIFLSDPVLVSLNTFILITIASILINGAIFLMTTAFQRAQKYYSSVFCLVYFQILYSILIGYFIFDEYLNFYAVIGAILIILSGIFSIPSQQKQKNA